MPSGGDTVAVGVSREPGPKRKARVAVWLKSVGVPTLGHQQTRPDRRAPRIDWAFAAGGTLASTDRGGAATSGAAPRCGTTRIGATADAPEADRDAAPPGRHGRNAAACGGGGEVVARKAA